MHTDDQFLVRFWGVRGTLPTPGTTTLHYGGNTSCVEVRCAGQTIILDGGTGIKALGDALLAAHTAQHVDVLLSHTHIDHVLGLPFFAPFYHQGFDITLWAGHLHDTMELRDVMARLMGPPLFPLVQDHFQATTTYKDFNAGEAISHRRWQEAEVAVTTTPLAHPDRATGYRISHKNKALCYITDYEHIPGAIDPLLVAFVRNADCLIYDSTYSDEEFNRYRGWGHSTWQQAVRLADAANVGKLVIFHHDPEATDGILGERASALEKMRPESIVAREGLTIHL